LLYDILRQRAGVHRRAGPFRAASVDRDGLHDADSPQPVVSPVAAGRTTRVIGHTGTSLEPGNFG